MSGIERYAGVGLNVYRRVQYETALPYRELFDRENAGNGFRRASYR